VENKGRIIFFGILIGAVTGLIAALMLTRRAAQSNRTTAITAGEGLKVGASVVGLLRTIAGLGDTVP
jgi:gas vesicle protein